MPVAKADELFSAAFTTFGQAATSETVVRTLGYAVPDALEGMLDVVHPTVSYVIPNLACSGQRPEKQHLAFHLRPHCPFVHLSQNITTPNPTASNSQLVKCHRLSHNHAS